MPKGLRVQVPPRARFPAMPVHSLVMVDCQLVGQHERLNQTAKNGMSPSVLTKTTEVIKVVRSMSLEEIPLDFKAREQRIMDKVQAIDQHYPALLGDMK